MIQTSLWKNTSNFKLKRLKDVNGTFNWEIATYGKSYCRDLDFFTDFEADYPAIVYNDALTSNENVPSKPPGLEYTDADIANFEERLEKIYGRGVHRVHVFVFLGLTAEMAEGLSGMMLMEHLDAQGQSVFSSRAWRRLFEVRGPLVHHLMLEFFSTFRFVEAVLDLDTDGALQF
ncbi:hypothetical protein Tco_0943993 [Tanacetum coccineum]